MDLDESKKLLEKNELPTEFSSEIFQHFYIAQSDDDSKILGLIGLESKQSVGLLRSLVVSDSFRGRGVGVKLVKVIEKYAHSLGIKNIYLLTNTADQFFKRLGYTAIPRNILPEFIRQTAEFSSICPKSSVCMQKSLEENK